MTFLALVGGWLILVFIGMPIGIAMITASMGYFYWSGTGLAFAVQRMTDTLNSFPLLAVPLFILAGTLLNTGGITTRLFQFANHLVGHIRGGLGHVNVLASLFFSGMSGSAIADAGGLGKMEIKAMRDAGYDDDFSGAITSASSMIGPLVPPSITMVIYGVVSNTSIGGLFLGGILPGLLCAGALMVMVYYFSVKRNYPVEKRATRQEICASFWQSSGALLTPVIIIVGIFSGAFSPTEAAAVTVVYALLLGLFVYRELTWRKLIDAVHETATISASIGSIIAGVGMFSYILAREQAPQKISALFLGITDDPTLFLFVVSLLIFILGSFIESLAILLIVVPLLVPVAIGLGIDTIHFGIIIVLNLMISTLTPPMGVSLFVVASVSGIPIHRLAKAILPWLIPPFVVLGLIIFIPPIALLLPKLAGFVP